MIAKDEQNPMHLGFLQWICTNTGNLHKEKNKAQLHSIHILCNLPHLIMQ